MERDVEKLRTLQLAMNRQTWQKLTELGVRPQTPLVLDFTFEAESHAAAGALAAFLQQMTNYRVEVDQLAGPPAAWGVFGSTQPTPVTLEFLDEWVTWMITAGHHHRCAFDGWGTGLGDATSALSGRNPEEFRWENARGQMQGLPAYVRLNSSFRPEASRRGYEYEVSATIQFNSTGANGMPTSEADLTAVDEIEDQIKSVLEQSRDTFLALVVTTAGNRRLVFYSANPQVAISRWEQELAPRLTSHRVNFDVRPDPAWASFLAFAGYGAASIN